MSTEVKTHVTREDYLRAERASIGRKCEWIDGEVREVTGAKYGHNVIAWNLGTLFGLQLSDRPFAVCPSEMKVRIPGGPYYYPDVVVVPHPPTFEGNRQDIVVDPLVVIEILSPSTESIDRNEKRRNYGRVPSLTDYLLVAQDECHVERHTRGDGAWVTSTHSALDEVVELDAIDCRLPLAEVYSRVLDGR